MLTCPIHKRLVSAVSSRVFKFLICLFLLFPVNIFAADLEKVVLQLRWYHQFQFAGYYAAIEQGYYREAGLEVVLRERGELPNAVEEVLAGRAQYGVENSRLLLHRLQGKPVVVLAAILQHSPMVWLTHADKGITNLQEFAGRRVKMTNDGTEIELKAALLNEGVDLAELDIVYGYADMDDYLSSDLDVIGAYLTDQPYYLQERGIPYRIHYPSTYGIDFYGEVLFTAEKEIEAYPERVRAFREASMRGWEYAVAHPEELVELILSKYSTKNSREHLLFEAAAMRKLILPEFVEIGHMNPGRWRHIAQVYADFGLVQSVQDLDKFIYDPNPTQELRFYQRLAHVGAVVIVMILIVAVLLYIFNSRLKREMARRRKAEANQDQLICELRQAMDDVKILRGLLPICGYCKKVRDEQGAWQDIDCYIEANSQASFTHGMCDSCFEEQQPELYQRYQQRKSPENSE